MRGITYFLSGLATLAVTASAFAAEKIGVVSAANGEVVAVRDGKPLGVKTGDAVYLNDVFETGAASEAQLIFADRSTLTLTPKSKITVDTYVYDPATQDGQMGVQGAKGVFRFVGGALSKQHPVTIKTPVATIGIRGGIAETNVAPDTGATEAIFVYGDALTMTNQNGETITTTDFGSGLELDTPNGLPGAMPGALVAARLETTAASAGIGSTTETQKLVSGEAVDTGLPGSDGSDAPAGGDGGDNGGGGASNGNEGASTGEASDAGTASLEAFSGNTESLPPVVTVVNIASDISSDQAVQNVAGENPVTPVPVAETPQQPVVPVAEVPVVPVPVATSGGGNAGPVYTHHGRFAVAKYDGTVWQPHETGDVRTLAAGTNFEGLAHVATSLATPSTVGDQEDIIAPVLSVEGEATINPFAMPDGEQFSGKGYNTFGNAMQYYQLNGLGASTDTAISMVQGISVADTLAAARGRSSSQVQFYTFLPDLYETRDTIGGMGFFDYHVADTNLTADYGASAPGTFNKAGLAVDWSKGKYFGGTLDFTSASPQMKLTFGSVNDNGGVNQQEYLKGFAYEFVGGSAPTGQAGGTKVGKDIFASETGPISGMVLDYDLSAGTTKGSQPVALMTTVDSTLTNAMNQLRSGTEYGFAGGVVVEGGMPSVYYSTHINDVQITKDASTGTVSGLIDLNEIGTYNRVKALFGDANGKANAFIANDYYAAQQGQVQYSDTATVNFDITSSASEGAMVAGKHISNVGTQCTNCQYTNWGIWAGKAEGTNGGAGSIDSFHMIPYVTGQVTPAVNVPATGTATYNGAAFANVISGGSVANKNGSFQAGIDFGLREISSMNVDLGGYTLSTPGGYAGAAIATSGDASFENIPLEHVPGTTVGYSKGALFGPAAEEIGGNFKFQDGSTQGAGIFHGKK